MKTYSQHLLAQAARVAELLDAGYTNRQIADEMHVSAPRIAQIKQILPDLRPYIGEPTPLDRLRSHREQLWQLRKHALELAATIREDLRELDEEIQSAEVDYLVGVRTA